MDEVINAEAWCIKTHCSFTVHFQQLVLTSFLCASENQYYVSGQGLPPWAHCGLVILYAGISVLYVGILLHCLKLELIEEFLARQSSLFCVFLTNKINWLPPPPPPTTFHCQPYFCIYLFLACHKQLNLFRHSLKWQEAQSAHSLKWQEAQSASAESANKGVN